MMIILLLPSRCCQYLEQGMPLPHSFCNSYLCVGLGLKIHFTAKIATAKVVQMVICYFSYWSMGIYMVKV